MPVPCERDVGCQVIGTKADVTLSVGAVAACCVLRANDAALITQQVAGGTGEGGWGGSAADE
jgi:hypothetical protein